MYKKYLLLFIVFFFWFINVSNANVEDFVGGIPYNERFVLSSSSDFTNYLSWNLYLKNITCSLDSSFSTNDLFKIDLYYSGALKNHLYIEKKWTLQIDINSYIWSSYRVFTSITWTNWYSVLCNFNWVLFDTIPNILNTSSTWTTISTQNIENSLNFQNDLLIYLFWFFIMFLSFLLSFSIYSYLSKSYFFNKVNIWKK